MLYRVYLLFSPITHAAYIIEEYSKNIFKIQEILWASLESSSLGGCCMYKFLGVKFHSQRVIVAPVRHEIFILRVKNYSKWVKIDSKGVNFQSI